MSKDSFSFGPFRLLPDQRTLLEGARTVRLGSRALDLLILLVRNAGTILGNDEITAHIWQDRFVDGTNLRVHIASLRKALGDGQGDARYIANVPGRGYSFIAPVSAARHTSQLPDDLLKPTNLATSLVRLIGRDETITSLATRLNDKRFVTITGPGGIGKTSLALAVAERLLDDYEDGIRFVDLSAVSSAEYLGDAVAQAFGFSVTANGSVQSLARQLADKHALIVLDNCEHLIEDVALLAEDLLVGAPRLNLLTTSREPLRANGEWVQRLPSLQLPKTATDLTAAQALDFPAIQLFVERARAVVSTFELTDRNVGAVYEICLRLDGIPLALELAAASLTHFSPQELERRLSDRFSILTRGRRTALPRHRTLRAAMAWSYDILTPHEQSVFRKLSIFSGTFTLEVADQVLKAVDPDLHDVTGTILALIDKSLVATSIIGESVRYRLLETTRAYALEQLAENQEYRAVAQSHASYYQNFYEKTEQSYIAEPTDLWLARYIAEIENLRTAIAWTFSEEGDSELGIKLVAGAAPLYLHLSLFVECQNHLEMALNALEEAVPHAASHHKKLLVQYGGVLMHITGKSKLATEIWEKTLAISTQEEDIDYRLRALWGLMTVNFAGADNQLAVKFAQDFSDLADQSTDPIARIVAHRLLGNALQVIGRLAEARQHIEVILNKDESDFSNRHVLRFQYDHLTVAHTTYAKILWLQGFPEQAQKALESGIDHATRRGQAASLHYVLVQSACPIAFYLGDTERARHYVDLLEKLVAGQAPSWHVWVECYRAKMRYMATHETSALETLREAREKFPENSMGKRNPEFLITLANGMAQQGDWRQGVQLIDNMLTSSIEKSDGWIVPEYRRVKGEILARRATTSTMSKAEELFRDSMEQADDQTALSWKLRSASSLAKLLLAQGKREEAGAVLSPVYHSFTEGFGSADLQHAQLLLQQAAD